MLMTDSEVAKFECLCLEERQAGFRSAPSWPLMGLTTCA